MNRDSLLATLRNGRKISAFGGTLSARLPGGQKEELAVITFAKSYVRAQLGLPEDIDIGIAGEVVGANLVYSENRVSETPISWERPRAEGSAEGAAEPETVTEAPLLGRMYWVTLGMRHEMPDVQPLLGGENAGGQWLGAGKPAPEPTPAPEPAANSTNTTAEAGDADPEGVPVPPVPLPPAIHHELIISVGIPDGDLNVYQHTYVPVEESAAVSADGSTGSASSSASSADFTAPFTIMTSNVWNVNPSKGTWRDPRDRWRQYALRLFQLGDSTRTAVPPLGGKQLTEAPPVTPDIIAFQEVRYDSSIGGFDERPYNGCDADAPAPAAAAEGAGAGADAEGGSAPTTRAQDLCAYGESAPSFAEPAPIDRRLGYDFKMGWAIASKWYNSTRTYAASDRYRGRTEDKWRRTTAAGAWNDFGAAHPLEGEPDVLGDPTNVFQKGRSPFHAPQYRGPPSFPRVHQMMRTHPHAQIAHLASHLPGYQFVYQPGQLYLDKNGWGKEGPHKDEEGPAIFSRWPIVGSDYLLLSRNASDDGDGHQRVVLHAVVDVSAAAGATASSRKPVLVDVYTVHLALSESARNRTVLELLDFVRRSARGSLQVVTGDMNAEPHEPAMRALVAAGIVVTDSSSSGSGDASSLPQLQDVWRAHYREPVPRDHDAASKRYGFTFPSDDPVKRIDLMFAGYRAGSSDSFSKAPLCDPKKVGVNGGRGCVHADRVWVVGQDPLPGTEGGEGRGLGMNHEHSPIYSSDHRAVVTSFRIPLQ
jgi:endonuclease/exonuclease/phosphatase family metal-dependent hydrolase